SPQYFRAVPLSRKSTVTTATLSFSGRMTIATSSRFFGCIITPTPQPHLTPLLAVGAAVISAVRGSHTACLRLGAITYQCHHAHLTGPAVRLEHCVELRNRTLFALAVRDHIKVRENL